ncbi:MAG: IS5 family transposase [Candidatus Aminicenantes bacterium]|nr:IS5 family transposase [Candidatus Aminicenantes bacterium]
MKGKTPDTSLFNLYRQQLENLVNPKHPLCKLRRLIPWDELEDHFESLYHQTGRPAKPIRLMLSLLILKQLYNLSDETIVQRWVENPYFQFFSGESVFQWDFPCHPTDLVYFRKRIGEEGVEKILKVSIELHAKRAKEKEVLVGTTVQEKNITFPTDTKLYKRIIEHCVTIAQKEAIELRQSYRRTTKTLMLAQRFRRHPKNGKKARAAQRKLKTIAGRLLRELERKLPASSLGRYSQQMKIFQQILEQKKNSTNKIYSIHEPQVYCISKGKDHKKYEYGSKASIVVTKNSGIIVGAVHFSKNTYDGHTLPETLKQTTELVGRKPRVAICDRGFRGKSIVDGTKIVIPKAPGKRSTTYQKQKARKRFRRRAGIEPIIGHLKSDFRLMRNYLKGSLGDSVNLMLAAAAFNFRKLLRQLLDYLLLFFTAHRVQLLALMRCPMPINNS